MWFEPNPVDSKAEKRAVFDNKINEIENFEGSDPTGREKFFQPMKNHIRLLKERFNDEIRHIFGIHTTALTANEAGYLVGFRTADEIRNRLAKAEKETHLRLVSKGY